MHWASLLTALAQVVLIDRKGMIRAQSDIKGTAELQDMTGLRPQVEKLLKER